MLDLRGRYEVLTREWHCVNCGKPMRVGERVYLRDLGNGSSEPWHPHCIEEQRRMTIPDCPRAKV